MHQQPQRPDSPSEHYTMYTEFEPDKRSALNSYHRSSFNALPNATRPTKHHATPSSTLPSTNPIMYRDPTVAFQDGFGPQMQFVDPSRTNFVAPFGQAEPFANYNKLPPPSQPHTLPHAVNPHSVSMSSQTPYGPHLANNVPLSNNVGHGNGGSNANGAGGGNTMHEEISTIFVVGFPDDMQEREFQNMFTFSSGFEAATLKIPNKEYTAYGIPGSTSNPSAAPGLPSLLVRQNALNDPYNLVTLNQGGVVVDGGRDGTMASWPAPTMDESYYAIGGLAGGVGGPPNLLTLGPNPNPNSSGPITGPVPPRKQIIGFAKFRTREAALEARDVLQGRRVDAEKGAVLKAEMAKKNLHTKRGPGVTANGNVGPANGVLPSNNLGAAPLTGPPGVAFAQQPQYDLHPVAPAHSQALPDLGGGAMSVRERQLGTLGAMGFSSGSTFVPSSRSVLGSLSKLWEDDGQDHTGGFSSGDESSGPIGPKGVGRRRAETNGDVQQSLRLGSGSAFDAFHSVPAHTGLVSPPLSSSKQLALSSSLGKDDSTPGPWDHFIAQPPSSAKLSQSSHSRSSRSSSLAARSTHSNRSARDEDEEDVHTNPELEPEDPNMTAKEKDLAHIVREVGTLAVSTNAHINGNVAGSTGINGSNSQGNTSPQLPSPSSGSGTSASAHSVGGASAVSASSSGLRLAQSNAQPCANPNFQPQNPNLANLSSLLSSTLSPVVSGVDQNPPINTLYVGNLPISPPPLGYPSDILEGSLRELFRTRPGFRRLSFKQKNTGPMCFVEFEDVNAATKTMNELYGNTLNGLVKGGGIRLSYSKNPLGVRTPTSANGLGPGLQQQQQMHGGRDVDRERGERFGYGGHIQAVSPTPHHHSTNQRSLHTHDYMISPPPPRFAGASTGTNQLSNMSFGNFSSSTFGHNPVGSGSNLTFGTTSSFQGNGDSGGGYRLADQYHDVQGPDLNAQFSPFDGHLDMASMASLPLHQPPPHQGPNSSQNQNF